MSKWRGALLHAFLRAFAPMGSILYAFLPVPAPLGQHLLCIFTCAGAPGAASSMHFYLCRRPWGSIFYAFLPVPALLGQHVQQVNQTTSQPANQLISLLFNK